ncbi:MAG: glycosyltransferase [Proteobacteria bacterium]|jgi:glycosyltransferase involved in cell wall biosynthesis|nr:glycosyltransferase [Pseudomonadota bacterium]
MTKTNIAGIFTIRNAVDAGYPFVESILSALSFCDSILVNDGGSNDGTLQYLFKLKELYPQIKIYKILDVGKVRWQAIDDVLNVLIKKVDTDWIFELQGDEMFHEKDVNLIKNIINNTKCNGIRSSRVDLTSWDTDVNKPTYKMGTMRLVRNIDGLTSDWGGDHFTINHNPFPRKGFTLHNVPPEYDALNLNLYHFCDIFPGNSKIKAKRHAEHLACTAPERISAYDSRKNSHIHKTQSKNISQFPLLMQGLCGSQYYNVREELLK